MSAALSLSNGFRDACQHAETQLPDWDRPIRPVVHNSARSLPNNSRGDDMPEATDPSLRKSARSQAERSETRTSLHIRLVQHVKDPSKVVARKTGASPDTVDLHRQGSVPQSWTQLIAYCRAYPAFGLEVVELMGLDFDQDRESYALFLQLQKQVRGE